MHISIPSRETHAYGIYNCHQNEADSDVLGINIFNCRSDDGFFCGQLKAQGCVAAGDPYAKQFSGVGNLRALTPWFVHRGVQVGDSIEITWTSSTDVVLRHLPQNS